MTALGDRDDDFFNFSGLEFTDEPQPSDPFVSKDIKPALPLTQQTEVQSSYILVNALLNILVQKGIIYRHEIDSLVKELHAEYIKKKKGRAE